MPVQDRTDEVGVLDRLVCQVVLQPGRNTFEVLVSFGEHPGLHHHLPEMLKSGTGRQLVQEVVTDRAAFGDERQVGTHWDCVTRTFPLVKATCGGSAGVLTASRSLPIDP